MGSREADPGASHPELSVLLVSFNSRHWLERSVPAIASAAEGRTCQIIVVDNGSTDGSADWLRGCDQVRSVLNSENLGFTRAMNQALREATGKYLVWLNVDCVLEPGSLRNGVAFLESHPEFGVAGGSLVDESGVAQPTGQQLPGTFAVLVHCLGAKRLLRIPGVRRIVGGLARGLRIRQVTDYLADPLEQPFREVGWVSGALLVTTRGVAERVGPLDERFWMYSEDTDWCKRVRDAGGRIATCADLRGLHAVGGSGGGSPLGQCHYYRSMWLYHRKHHPRNVIIPLLLEAYFFWRTVFTKEHEVRRVYFRLARWGIGTGADPCGLTSRRVAD